MKHTVTKQILHNGKRLGKGATVDLSPEEAQPLIASGHIAIPVEKEKVAK